MEECQSLRPEFFRKIASGFQQRRKAEFFRQPEIAGRKRLRLSGRFSQWKSTMRKSGMKPNSMREPVCRSIFKGVKALRRRPGDTPELEKAMKAATSSCVSDFRSNNSGKADTAVFCCSLNRPEFSLARSGGGAVAHDPDCSILSLKFPRRKAADLLTPHGSGAGVDNRFYSNSLQLRTCDGENPVMRRNSLEK